MVILNRKNDMKIHLDQFWYIKPKTMRKKVWNKKFNQLKIDQIFLKSLNLMNNGFNKIDLAERSFGGARGNLLFFKNCCFWIPHLWEIVSTGLKNNNAKSFKMINQWFAIQGFKKEMDISFDEIYYLKIDVSDLDQLPNSVPRVYYSLNTNKKKTGPSPYSQSIKNLFIRASDIYPELTKIKKFKIFKEGSFINKITNSMAYIKHSKTLPLKSELYIPKYDEDLISATFRIAYYEFKTKQAKRSFNAKSIQNLFNSNKSRKWIATRKKPRKNPDFKFIVMIDDYESNIKKMLLEISHQIGGINRTETVEDLIQKVKNKWPHGSLEQINKARIRSQLTSVKLLSQKSTWSFSEANRNFVFQGWLDRGYKLPDRLLGKHGLLWEARRGPLNYFLEGLFTNIEFRKAVILQTNIQLSLGEAEVHSDYVGSTGYKPKFLGQTTCHHPDAATNLIPNLGYIEFISFKRESDVSSHNAISELLKNHNSVNQHYRNFQMNVYTTIDILNIEGLKRKKELIRLIKNEEADGVIVFTESKNPSAELPRFGEIYNAARLEWKKYRKKEKVPPTYIISQHILKRISKFQRELPTITELNSILYMFNFNAKTIHQFVEYAFWNYIWKLYIRPEKYSDESVQTAVKSSDFLEKSK